MTVLFAFQGFRHNHIFDLYTRASAHSRIEITGASEECPDTRRNVQSQRGIPITHQDYADMLDDVECDVVAIGDYYARRGRLVIEALSRGKHVLCDKPLCTSLQEFDAIHSLAAQHRLSVFCMLDLRDWGHFLTMRRAVREGMIGEVTAASFGGQHELKYGQRPCWYFEPGKHGGTLNDLAVHGIDLISWITGLRFRHLRAARTWNARIPDVSHFHDGAQFMAELENGAGVLGDVSYFLPEPHGPSSPHYWRTTIWGTRGVVETSFGDRAVRVWLAGESESRQLERSADRPGGYLEAFLRAIDDAGNPGDLSSDDSLDATRAALIVQDAADNERHSVAMLGSLTKSPTV